MAYALFILEPPGQRQARTQAEGEALFDRMVRFSEDLRSRGLLTLSQSLKSDSQGVRVRLQANRPTIVDGPFAESKEMIGGFLLLSCESRDQAIAIAQECPATAWASVEVREFGPCFS